MAYKWVAADALYGNSPEFLRKLDKLYEVFMADVHCDQVVYLEDPKPYVPERKSNKGKKPTRLKTDQPGIRVDQLAKQAPESDWIEVKTRNSTKGQLITKVLHKKVWLWDGEEEQAHLWHLVIGRDKKSKSKYSVSNAPWKHQQSALPLPRSFGGGTGSKELFRMASSYGDGDPEASGTIHAGN